MSPFIFFSIKGVNLWQSVELRQFTSLKHLLIIQGGKLCNQIIYYSI